MTAEAQRTVACFGGQATVRILPGGGPAAATELPLVHAAALLRQVHARLTRFDPASDLGLLNADPREVVPASLLLRRFARAVGDAGRLSGGLVDATLLAPLEAAGYGASRTSPAGPAPAGDDTRAPTRRAAATPSAAQAWRAVRVDDDIEAIVRPPGVRLDSGGIAKGLAADLVARRLSDQPAYLVDCGGDLRIGGSAGRPRPVEIRHPATGAVVAVLRIADGAVATSGITRRAWRGPDGLRAHHLIDPGTGRPAWTGVTQATAIAATALEAEVRAKAALLAGPDRAGEHLLHGGVLVLDDGTVVEHPAHERSPVLLLEAAA